MVTKINNLGSCWTEAAGHRRGEGGKPTAQYVSVPDPREPER